MRVTSTLPSGGTFIHKYKPTIGYHASVIFESYFTERGSYTFGFKYCNVQYEYTIDGSNARPMQANLYKPDGSGLDFIIGYYYHF